MRAFKIALSAFAGGLIVGVMLGFPSGWNAYAAVDGPGAVTNIKTTSGTYPDWMRRQMANEVYWLNYAARHRDTRDRG